MHAIAAGRVSKITGTLDGQQSMYLGSTSYAPHGGVGLMQMGNNVWRSFAYDSRLQIREIADLVNNDGGQVLLDQNFDWLSNGNLNWMTTSHGGPGYQQPLTFKEYYGYDMLNRVMWANGKDVNEGLLWGENFEYDRYGNRWMAQPAGIPGSGLTPTVDVYNSANQMNATNYDLAGNQTRFGANTLIYDAESHVTDAYESSAEGPRHTQYVYL